VFAVTNFDFLSAEKNFATFADACIEAEKSIGISPALCALGVRKSAELVVKWLYSVDSSLRLPYKDNFSALVYNPSFTASVDDSIMSSLRYIIKLGNFSTHTNKKVSYREAVLSLQNLFEFVLFIDYCYGSSYEERDFDETLLASEAKQAVSAAEFDRLREELETRSADRAALEASDLVPFREMIAKRNAAKNAKGARGWFVMATHTMYPALDAKRPASLSPAILQGLLREELSYDGVIVTDDLEMGAISRHYGFDRAGVEAILAGADLVLVCHDYAHETAVYNGLLKAVKSGEISKDRLDTSVRRIVKAKIEYLE